MGTGKTYWVDWQPVSTGENHDWDGEPGLGLEKPQDLIGNPFQSLKIVICVFTAHGVSHEGTG